MVDRNPREGKVPGIKKIIERLIMKHIGMAIPAVLQAQLEQFPPACSVHEGPPVIQPRNSVIQCIDENGPLRGDPGVPVKEIPVVPKGDAVKRPVVKVGESRGTEVVVFNKILVEAVDEIE